jgi:hypothetical protein
MRKALDQGKRSRDPDLDSTTAIYSKMLLGKGAGDHGIALPDQLERSRLDFTLESLHAIDRYLDRVRARQDGLAGFVYLNTVVAVACYLGEVIRRGTPVGECQWMRAPGTMLDSTSTDIRLGEFADIVLVANGSDRPLRLARVVARFVSSNGHQSSTYEYAVVAMKRVWVSATAAPA